LSAIPSRPRRYAGIARFLPPGNSGDTTFKSIAFLATVTVLGLAAAIVLAIVAGSMDSIRRFGFFGFLVSGAWDPVNEEFGALNVLVGTVVSSFIAVLLAVPVALGISIFITEMAPPYIRGVVAFLVDMLAAIPSIVYGLWGFFVLAPFIRGAVDPFLSGKLGWLPLFEGPGYGVSMLAATQRLKNKESVIQRTHPARLDAKFLMSLSQNEMVLLTHNGKEDLYRFDTAAATSGQMWFRHHTAGGKSAEKLGEVSKKPNTIQAIKVTVDTLGRVRWAND